MTLILLTAFDTAIAIALGFVLGRIWQIRQYEIEQRGFSAPPVARITRT
jgi:hypothetical protein